VKRFPENFKSRIGGSRLVHFGGLDIFVVVPSGVLTKCWSSDSMASYLEMRKVMKLAKQHSPRLKEALSQFEYPNSCERAKNRNVN